MSDFNIDFDLDASELASALGLTVDELVNVMDQSLLIIASGAYTTITSALQEHNLSPTQKATYLQNLDIQKIPNGYIIELTGPHALRIEDGGGVMNMREILLNSNAKVSTGPRAGEDWVRTSKEGKKYASVPFPKKSGALEKPSGNLLNDIKQLTATNLKGKTQKLTDIFRDLAGSKVSGFAASVNPNNATHPFLQGVSKYQSISTTGKVSSDYVVFRTVSENSPSHKWQRKAEKGLDLFTAAEDFVEYQLNQLADNLL